MTGPLYGPPGYTAAARMRIPPISLTARAQVRRRPATIPRSASGIVTIRNTVALPAPSERAASRTRSSTARNERSLASTVYGALTKTITRTTPQSEFMIGIPRAVVHR